MEIRFHFPLFISSSSSNICREPANPSYTPTGRLILEAHLKIFQANPQVVLAL